MSAKRHIEVYTAACPACDEVIAQINEMSCPCCELEILDMHQPAIAQRARDLGVRSVPAVAVDGQLLACCTGDGPDADALRKAGIGQPF